MQINQTTSPAIEMANDADTSRFTEQHITPTEEELKTVPQRSYKCDLCGIQVKTLANLRIHRVKTHRIVESDSDVAVMYRTKGTVKKIFHCPVAGCKYQDRCRGFPKQSALRQHYIWVHGGRDHMCSSCFRLFPSLRLLERHKLSCGQSHVCVECGRRYSEVKYLRQHMKRAKHTSLGVEPMSTKSLETFTVVPQPASPTKCSQAPKDAVPAKPQFSPAHCLQPVILPVVIPFPITSSASEVMPCTAFDPQAIAEAVSCAIRPVLDRFSVETSTQTSMAQPQTSSLVHVAIDTSPPAPIQLAEKASEVDVTATGFMNMPSFAEAGVTALPTDLNLHPVGSQTDELFGNPYDRPCLHVETQTSDLFRNAMTCVPPRNLQTPQPGMVGTQTLDPSGAAAEFLSNTQTQTDPIEAWMDADFSDIETQTNTYDLDALLGMTCSQTQTNV